LRKLRTLAAACAVAGIASTVGLTASAGASPSGSGKTLVVWSMQGDLNAATLKAIDTKFTQETGAKVDVETQQWTNINTKITTALATSTPPDIIDLGNTDVGSYAANGGLLDLTADKSQLEQGGTWLPGLAGPATIGGKLYAVPSFAGDRAVIYNKKMWAEAGITSVPTTYTELTSDLNKIKAKFTTVKDFSAFYLPGQYWYDGIQWVWDAGGTIASQNSSGKWQGDLDTPAAQKGLQEFKTFQNAYSTTASERANTSGTGEPNQDNLLADGQTAAIQGDAWEIPAVLAANKKLTSADLGTFPFPGVSGHNQPVMIGGSDWGIAARSQNPGLAETWVKIAASPAIQMGPIVAASWIPNTVQEAAKAEKKTSAQAKAFYTAAQDSKSTPAASNWVTIEGDGQIEQFFSDVVSGSKSTADAAKGFDAHLSSVLNGS
jgi:N,N'-diacetylchitobiose transport system substrate-binding protein